MMIFACLMVVSLMMCNDFSRQGRLVAGRGKGLRGRISEVWTAGHGGVKGRGRGRANLSLWALYLLFFCVLCEKKNVFEIRWGVFSLTEHTEASPPAPLRMERGVVCEVTPFGLLLIGNGPLNIWRTCRGNLGDHSPLHSERGRGWGRLELGVRSFIASFNFTVTFSPIFFTPNHLTINIFLYICDIFESIITTT